MRKVFIVVLAMLMALVGMSAAAMGETVISLNKRDGLNSNIPFSNGYTGFCIDQHLTGAAKNGEFTTADTSRATNNTTGQGIDQILKNILTKYHNSIFSRNNNGGYAFDQYINPSTCVLLNKVFWHYSDGYGTNPENEDEDLGSAVEALINSVNAHMESNPNYIGDHDSTLYQIDSDTKARFDFKVMVPDNNMYQEFFAFMITYYRDVFVEEGQAITFGAEIPNSAEGDRYNPNETPYEWAVDYGDGFEELGLSSEGMRTIDEVSIEDHNTKYRCIVTDISGCKSYYYFTLNVVGADVPPSNNPPVITDPDQDKVITKTVGDKIELTVEAKDADEGDELTYTWYKSGEPESVGTGATFTINECDADDDGDVYYCVVSDGTDSVTSPKYTLNVKEPEAEQPTISWVSKPEGSVESGKTVTLEVSATPEGATLQWYVDDGDGAEPIIGETGKTLTITAQAGETGNDGYKYYCVATNGDKTAETETKYTLSVAAKCVPAKITDLTVNGTKVEDKDSYTAADGAGVTMCVSTTGTDMTYQWSVKNPGEETFTDISGATAAEYDLGTVSTTDNGKTYRCTVENSCGKDTREFTLSVTGKCVPAKITELTVNGTKVEDKGSYTAADGAGVTMCVSATGTDLTYQWSVKNPGEENFTDISGATAAEYDLGTVSAADNGKTYRCTVENSCGKDTREFTLSVASKCVPPVIISPEKDDTYTADAGTNVKLCVTATGTDLTYQWSVKNPGEESFKDISGATAAEYDLGAVTADDNGKTFRCTVKNSCGTATRDFTLNVPAQDEDMPPAYTHPSQEKEVPFKAGETVVLTMPSEDGESVRFAWYAIGGDGDPVLLDGEDGDTFTISNCASEYDGATLVCVASDEAGNTESLAFKLVMIPEGEPPVITSPTSDTSILVCEGESVTLSITAENADGYQWYVDKDGDGLMEEIEGATDPSYTILSVKNEMSDYAYACVAYNEFGYAGSPVFVFQVDGVPKMPATGDNSMPFVWLSMMLASAAACVYMLRSRRAE